MTRVFLLSPAQCNGPRARILLNAGASFDLARRVRNQGGAPLGEVFAFLSGLYFRGKLAYARRFARAPAECPSALVITSSFGLVPPEDHVDGESLRSLADVAIDLQERRYLEPLLRDALALRASVPDETEIVLLGSIAQAKYVEPLAAIFGRRLLFPEAFVGRGDMSRGGLLLRSADAGFELTYVPVEGATRRGSRPPRLPPRRRA